MIFHQNYKNLKLLKSNQGQILVEYLLLLVIALACATLLTKALVGRSENNTGVVVKQWDRIIQAIGNDVPDCANQKNFSKASCPP